MHQISSSIDSFLLHLTLAHLNLVELFFYVYRIKDKQRLSTSGALALKVNASYQTNLTLMFSTSRTGLTCESLNFSHSFVAGF